MTWSIAVTFETPTLAAPTTVRVETAARSVTAAVRRAITAAKRQMPGRRWTSMVILIERGGADGAPERRSGASRCPPAPGELRKRKSPPMRLSSPSPVFGAATTVSSPRGPVQPEGAHRRAVRRQSRPTARRADKRSRHSYFGR